MKYLLLVFLLLGASLMAKPPFLSQGYIPHYTKKIAKNWDNDFLELTDEQRVKLIKVRKNTMKSLGNLKAKLEPLEQKLADKIVSGTPPKQLRNLVKQIAKYKEAATMVHLRCVYNTQKILTKDQLDLLPSL
jgi:chorismate mutase